MARLFLFVFLTVGISMPSDAVFANACREAFLDAITSTQDFNLAEDLRKLDSASHVLERAEKILNTQTNLISEVPLIPINIRFSLPSTPLEVSPKYISWLPETLGQTLESLKAWVELLRVKNSREPILEKTENLIKVLDKEYQNLAPDSTDAQKVGAQIRLIKLFDESPSVIDQWIKDTREFLETHQNDLQNDFEHWKERRSVLKTWVEKQRTHVEEVAKKMLPPARGIEWKTKLRQIFEPRGMVPRWFGWGDAVAITDSKTVRLIYDENEPIIVEAGSGVQLSVNDLLGKYISATNNEKTYQSGWVIGIQKNRWTLLNVEGHVLDLPIDRSKRISAVIERQNEWNGLHFYVGKKVILTHHWIDAKGFEDYSKPLKGEVISQTPSEIIFKLDGDPRATIKIPLARDQTDWIEVKVL